MNVNLDVQTFHYKNLLLQFHRVMLGDKCDKIIVPVAELWYKKPDQP